MEQNRIISYVKYGVLGASALIFLYIALFMSRSYWEFDSYALPIVAMQYHRTTVVDESCMELLINDFPGLYQSYYEYDKENGMQLIQIGDNQYISYYFPAYSFAVMIPKLFLQLFQLDQELCFGITNALFYWFAMFCVARWMKASDKGKIITMLLLLCNPAIFYIRYCSAEVFLLSLVVMSLVFYTRRWQKRSAGALTIAGLVQPMVMMIGFVYIVNYLIQLYVEHRPQNCIITWLKCWKELLLLALCYVWVFVPFIYNYIMMGSGSETAGMYMTENWLSRVYAYALDLNFGLAAYFPVTLILFVVISVICIVKKKFFIISYDIMLAGLLSVVGLIDNINCGMFMCARYILWIMPVMLIGVVMGCEAVFNRVIYIASMAVALVVSLGLTTVNYRAGDNEVQFNRVTRAIMNVCPELYIPHQTTFWVRANNTFINDRNGVPSMAVYTGTDDGHIRKVLISADEEEQQEFMKYVHGSEEDIQYIQEKLDEIPDDGEYHYINISKATGVKLDYYGD